MQGEKKERWLELCAQAAVEQDPKKLIRLVTEINDLLEEKERRLGIVPPQRLAGAEGSLSSREN
jgi:hypothetical protein